MNWLQTVYAKPWSYQRRTKLDIDKFALKCAIDAIKWWKNQLVDHAHTSVQDSLLHMTKHALDNIPIWETNIIGGEPYKKNFVKTLRQYIYQLMLKDEDEFTGTMGLEQPDQNEYADPDDFSPDYYWYNSPERLR